MSRSSRDDGNMAPSRAAERRAYRKAKKKAGTYTPQPKPKPHETPDWLKPFLFTPGNSFGSKNKGRYKKPITDRYRAALEAPIPDDKAKILGFEKGAVMADAIAWRMVAIAGGNHKRSIEAAREIRESIEGKARQQVDLSVINSLPDKLRKMRERLDSV